MKTALLKTTKRFYDVVATCYREAGEEFEAELSRAEFLANHKAKLVEILSVKQLEKNEAKPAQATSAPTKKNKTRGVQKTKRAARRTNTKSRK